MTPKNHASKNRSRPMALSLIAACLFTLQLSPLLADARTDGDMGIEAFKRGDLIRAMELLESSARDGYAPAQVTLAYILDISERDEEAFKWYQEAAAADDPAGIFGLGSMYQKGEGVERDPVKAGELIKRAAEMGHSLAIRVYAYALEDGSLGFESDEAAALEWYRRAAEAGDQLAMHRLKEANELGQLGLPVDLDKAADWEEKMKNRGE